jgi:predicted  nucleic acid-binding Zn-ribbon protein
VLCVVPALQAQLSDGRASSEALQQQLQAAQDQASALQQQLVDVRQHAQEQVKELRASNAALHVRRKAAATRLC